MRFSRLFGPEALELATLLFTLPAIRAYNFTATPSPNLDLSALKRVALTGDFDSISLYTYTEQDENTFNTNGSQSLFAQLPNGAFETLAKSDAAIRAMCPFYRSTGELYGVIIGGNFTSLSNIPTQGVALFNVTSNSIVPLPGLNGSVNAMWCDKTTDSVYIGGDFRGANSTNAIAWVGSAGWTNMPFQGFNAPVNTVARAPNGNIIWGGSFTGLGNMSTPKTQPQIINLSSANLSAGSSSLQNGFSDPSNIVCKSNGQDGAGNTWLLQDQTPGFWAADFGFGFVPTTLRLWNTHQDGRGTKTWRFSNNPNSILRFNYTDPDTNQLVQCDQTCPLSNRTDIKYQDFNFTNPIGMNSLRIDISDWWGQGGGLDGIELLQDDIFSYAVSSLNEPTCGVGSFPSNATATGPWKVTPSGQSVAEYLTANLTGPGINSSSASVTFFPDIKQAGNYTVTIYTPGCQQDNSCDLRGIANVTGKFTAIGSAPPSQIYQTNDFDKYDQIYSGPVDASSSDFRPSVTLTPLESQNSSITLVALRVRFDLLDQSSVGLNGLYEYDPNNNTANTDFKNSKIDSIGVSLDPGADVINIQVLGSSTFVMGNFTSKNISNFIGIDQTNNTMQVPGNGLNAPINAAFQYATLLFVGGNFTDTNSTHTPGLSHLAVYDTSQNTWAALGNGVDGPASSIVPLELNVTEGVPEECIIINGAFSQVLATNGHPAFQVAGLAVWAPARNAWLNNLNVEMQAISGQLSIAVNVTGNAPLMAGTISAQGLAFSDSAELSAENGVPSLSSSGLIVQPNQGAITVQKRAEEGSSSPVNGIMTGIYDTANSRNQTILAGHFVATGSDGSNITNLALINNNQQNQVSGLSGGIDTNSTIFALSTNNDLLYIGGQLTGNASGSEINGFVTWNLAQSAFNSSLPPALGGSDVAVYAINTRPSTSDVYVAGNFDSAGGLGCPGLCIFTNGAWKRPGNNFSGNVSSMLWQGNDQLLVVGNLTVQNNPTSVASYDANSQAWSVPSGAANVPGPITALSPASSDGSSYWVAGQQSNHTPFLMKYNGNSFQAAPPLGDQSMIMGLSVFSLTQSHDSNNFLDPSFTLLVTGNLNLPNFGNVSGVLFDGNNYTVFLLSNSGNNPGSLGQVVTEQSQTFSTGGGSLAVGFVVLIALAIALAIIFLLIAIGLFVERRRRAAEGYRPAPQNYFEKTGTMGRIPPDRLFSNLNAPSGPRV